MKIYNYLSSEQLTGMLANYKLSSVSNFFPSRDKIHEISKSKHYFAATEDFWLMLHLHDGYASTYFSISDERIEANDAVKENKLFINQKLMTELKESALYLFTELSLPSVIICEQTGKSKQTNTVNDTIIESMGFAPYIERKRLRLKLPCEQNCMNLTTRDNPYLFKFADIEDAMKIYEAYLEVFEPFTSCIQHIDDLRENIQSQLVLTLKENTDGKTEKLVGIIEYSLKGKSAHIIHVVIMPEYRKKGLSYLLTKKLLDKLNSDGIRQVELWVQTDNSAALKLYQGLNFKADGWYTQAYIRAIEVK